MEKVVKQRIYDFLNDNSPRVFEDYYTEAEILNSQIKKEDVKNVAVVAKYGAGKSSVINTYLSKYRSKELKTNHNINKLGSSRKNNYVRISLSTFNGVEYDEVAIERSILQQLLYSRRKNELPNSKIERTAKSSRFHSFLMALVLTSLLCIIGTLSLDILHLASYSMFWPEWIKISFYFIIIGIILWLLYYIIHYKKLRRIKYKDLEADFYDDKVNKEKINTNLINKFVDEVLYFFNCVPIDLVIFEDLDRFNETKIFSKLRELNLIINNSQKNKKVTFIYAVRSDLFKNDEERAKFFDFILPIIPVINPISAKIKIEEKLSQLCSIDPKLKLTSRLIKGVTVFIPDMRILNNTFNDYIIMYMKIFKGETVASYLDVNKLFALCLYKNIFPYDYVLLEKQDGLIPLVIDISKCHEKMLFEIEDEIKELNVEIREYECLKFDFETLKSVFISEISKCGHRVYNGSIDPWNLSTFEDLDFTKLIHPKYMNNRYSINLNNENEILSPTGERFVDLERLIKSKKEGAIEELKHKLKDLEQQKQEILSWELSSIVQYKGVDFCTGKNIPDLYKDKVQGLKLSDDLLQFQFNYLRFLISNGFIDEHYIEYTLDYKSNVLSSKDRLFLQHIESEGLEFYEKVDNLENVLRFLDDTHFNKDLILNKFILDNLEKIKLFSNKEGDKKFTNLIALLLKFNNPKVKEKLIKYINVSGENEIIEMLREMFFLDFKTTVKLVEEEEILLDKKYIFVYYLIENSKYNLELIKNNYIKTLVSECEKYMDIFNMVKNTTKVCEFLENVLPKFKRLDPNVETNIIQQYIINRNMFEINLHNLKEVFKNCEKFDEYFYSKNYSYIFSYGKDKTLHYIKDDINLYTERILLNNEITFFDEEKEIMEKILKDTNILIDNRRMLLNKMDINVENICDFEVELYEDFIKEDKMDSTWYNLLHLYEKKGFEIIKDYLTRTNKIEGDLRGSEGMDESIPLKLLNDIFIEMAWNDLEKIMKFIPVGLSLNDLDVKKIADEKLLLLIDNGCIKFNSKDLNYIYVYRNSLNKYLSLYEENVIDNYNIFFEIIFPVPVDKRVYENGRYLIKRSYSSKPNAQEIIANIISCKDISVKLKEQIIDSCASIIKIENYEDVYADYIVSNLIGVPSKILWQFTNSNKVSVDEKKEILAICLERVDMKKESDKFFKYFNNLDNDWENLVISDIPLRVESNYSNEMLFSKMKEKNIISKRKVKNNILIIKKI